MLELSGLLETPNNPAYAKSAGVFSLEVGRCAKEQTKDEDGIL